MTVFDFKSYKEFINKWREKQPNKGHGQFVKFAEALGISTVLVTQIFNGAKNLSLEHAILLADFLGLTQLEKDYFLLLVNYERAGSHKLQEYFHAEILKTQKKRKESLENVVAKDVVISEADKAVFYSNWMYSAIRLQTSIDGYQTVDSLADQFKISKEEIVKMLDVLLRMNLVIQTENGYRMGPARTHLEADSPFVKQRQISWRVKAFSKMDQVSKTQMFYTAPMSISEEMYDELKKGITNLIADLNSKITKTKPQKLACLNIDLFEV